MTPRVYPADLVEVTAAVADAAARRLTTKDAVKAMLNISGSTEDGQIEAAIDRASGLAVDWCALASGVDGSRPTFGAETLRATWFNSGFARSARLRLPWRVPVTSVTSVVEDGTALVSGSDYRLQSAKPGVLLRLSGDSPICWSSRKLVVTFIAGWSLPGSVPPEVEEGVLEHVKAMYLGRDRDPNVRSEAEPDVYSETFNVWGGDTMSAECPLVPKFASAVAPYRNPAP